MTLEEAKNFATRLLAAENDYATVVGHVHDLQLDTRPISGGGYAANYSYGSEGPLMQIQPSSNVEERKVPVSPIPYQKIGGDKFNALPPVQQEVPKPTREELLQMLLDMDESISVASVAPKRNRAPKSIQSAPNADLFNFDDYFQEAPQPKKSFAAQYSIIDEEPFVECFVRVRGKYTTVTYPPNTNVAVLYERFGAATIMLDEQPVSRRAVLQEGARYEVQLADE